MIRIYDLIFGKEWIAIMLCKYYPSAELFSYLTFFFCEKQKQNAEVMAQLVKYHPSMKTWGQIPNARE